MYLRLNFSSEAATLLTRAQGLDSSEGLRVLTDIKFNNICNVERKSGSKNDNGEPTEGSGFQS